MSSKKKSRSQSKASRGDDLTSKGSSSQSAKNASGAKSPAPKKRKDVSKEVPEPEPYVLDYQAFRDKLYTLWSKPLEKMPVNKDLSRLSKEIQIFDVVNQRMDYRDTPNISQGERACNVMLSLARVLDGPEVEAKVDALLKEFVAHKDGDVGEQLRGVLARVDDDWNFLPILRCINQEIISPGVMELRKGIYGTFPYKDIKGSWRVLINVHSSYVTVIHKKGERSHEEGLFSLSWRFEIKFDWPKSRWSDNNGMPFNAAVTITDYNIAEGTTEERSNEITQTLSKFFSPEIEFYRLWKRPLTDLPVHEDLALLGTKLRIFDGSKGNTLYRKTIGDTRASSALIKDVLVFLSSRLGPPETVPIVQKVLENSLTPSTKDGEMCQVLNTCLLELQQQLKANGIINPPVLRIVKTFNHHVIEPSALVLREAIYEKLPYKEVKGSWFLYLMLDHPYDENGLSRDALTLTHRKREQAISTNPGDYFQFEWVVTFKFNRDYDGFDLVNTSIVDYVFHEYTSPETRLLVKETLDPFFRAGSTEYTKTTMQVDELINCCINRLLACSPSIQTYHPNMSHSLPLAELLISLSSSLKKDGAQWSLPPVITLDGNQSEL
mmetsp:Transcript_1789/g.1969  ORF Transcript_1789/g.1969 Transcript_1789/m.1969 type:complete len:607 (-) Transcript_1789:210-2030(-)